MEVYLDNAATTPIAPEVVEAMLPLLKNGFGNPSSSHSFGRTSKALIENSRRKISKLINCNPSEIIFTSGGTEADNMAIVAAVNLHKVTRVITSRIEHPAVGQTLDALEPAGLKIEYVDIDSKGNVDLGNLESLLSNSKDRTLVSLMHANNEIGTLLPILEVSRLCRSYEALFHSDTVQSMAHYAFDMKELDIDFLTCSAHKFHGPKGIGFLYVKSSIGITSLIHGGGQERGFRGGTENVYGIVGLAKAMEISYENLPAHQKHVQELKSHMINELKNDFDDIQFHGEIDPEKSLYTVLNVCFPKTDKSNMLLFTLDLKGVAVSGGSACSSGAVSGSHVLAGINAPADRPNARFSFSRYTTLEEVNYALDQVRTVFEIDLV